MILPQARNLDILVQDSPNEVLIYDLITDKVFALNTTLKIIYHACDGKTTVSELKKSHALTDEMIFLAIDELKKVDLLENSVNIPIHFKGTSRREVIKKIGLTSMMAIPLIVGITAPTAAQSLSSCVNVGRTLNGNFVNDSVTGTPFCTTGSCLSVANTPNSNGCCSGYAVDAAHPDCVGEHACICQPAP